MRFRAVLFDLDGTLLDTLEDIALAANAVLAGRGFRTHEVDAYRHFVGEGVSMLFRRALPEAEANADLIARCAGEFREEYGRTWNVHTRPYDGVPELLDVLAAARLPQAVLSNKPDEFTQRCVREYLSNWEFRVVLGQREGVPRKPDPAGALEIAAAAGVPPEHFLYLGDSATDMQAALSAGMHPVGALWGFRPLEELQAGGARAIIRRPMELLGILDENAAGG
jgi:phosphoglycolate phosphatase